MRVKGSVVYVADTTILVGALPMYERLDFGEVVVTRVGYDVVEVEGDVEFALGGSGSAYTLYFSDGGEEAADVAVVRGRYIVAHIWEDEVVYAHLYTSPHLKPASVVVSAGGAVRSFSGAPSGIEDLGIKYRRGGQAYTISPVLRGGDAICLTCLSEFKWAVARGGDGRIEAVTRGGAVFGHSELAEALKEVAGHI